MAIPSSAAPSMYSNMKRGRRFFAICRRSSTLQAPRSLLFMTDSASFELPKQLPLLPEEGCPRQRAGWWELLRRRDDDLHQRLGTSELDGYAGARRRVLAVDPGQPRVIHRRLLRHVGNVDSRRQQLRLVRAALGEQAVD